MDVICLTSLAIACSVAVGMILKEVGCCNFKKFNSHCGNCCDVNIEAKSNSPNARSATSFNSMEKLKHFIDDRKQQADEIMKTIERRFRDPLITIPPTNII